jgi:hypothetical protein
MVITVGFLSQYIWKPLERADISTTEMDMIRRDVYLYYPQMIPKVSMHIHRK